jgi:hypothetical protein
MSTAAAALGCCSIVIPVLLLLLLLPPLPGSYLFQWPGQRALTHKALAKLLTAAAGAAASATTTSAAGTAPAPAAAAAAAAAAAVTQPPSALLDAVLGPFVRELLAVTIHPTPEVGRTAEGPQHQQLLS